MVQYAELMLKFSCLKHAAASHREQKQADGKFSHNGKLAHDKRNLKKCDEAIKGYPGHDCHRSHKVERNILVNVGIILENADKKRVHNKNADAGS